LTRVAWLIPARRQISATGTPSTSYIRMNAFCARENHDAFIVFRSSQPRDLGAENSSFKRTSSRGSDQRATRSNTITPKIGTLAAA